MYLIHLCIVRSKEWKLGTILTETQKHRIDLIQEYSGPGNPYSHLIWLLLLFFSFCYFLLFFFVFLLLLFFFWFLGCFVFVFFFICFFCHLPLFVLESFTDVCAEKEAPHQTLNSSEIKIWWKRLNGMNLNQDLIKRCCKRSVPSVCLVFFLIDNWRVLMKKTFFVWQKKCFRQQQPRRDSISVG